MKLWWQRGKETGGRRLEAVEETDPHVSNGVQAVERK